MTSTVGPILGEEPASVSQGFHNGNPDAYTIEVFYGSQSSAAAGDSIPIEAKKTSRADEIVVSAVQKLGLGNPLEFELIEVFSSGGQICKERRLLGSEFPVKIQLLWPRLSASSISISDAYQAGYNFMLRRKELQQRAGWVDTVELNPIEGFLTRFLQQPQNREYQDLCNLPDLNEATLLENLKKRFNNGMIYTYVGSILISINPFRFFPIYNPKYVRMYQNRRLSDLPPHIFAIADSAYYSMMKMKSNQCIVISGESGSGKTESTNLLLHHLSALSQRGFYSDGIEQSILGVGPVLEAFGNAKTVHNNNSSRFGKFVQVNYRANGSVHGASVEKYLLEKSRIVSQASNERNYHVFYYLLAGAGPAEIDAFCLGAPREYFYLNQNDCYRLEGLESDNEAQEFARLRHAMDVVGFSPENQYRVFTVLSAVLHIGNIEFKKKSEHGYQDEAASVKNMKEITIVSKLLKVKESMLIEALTKRKTMAGGDIVVMSYRMAEAISTRDAMSKCLYSALFDWIVFEINAALVSKHESKQHEGNSIGVLDIFGFEDFHRNSFEQFCINYANESLHFYFNQHIFKFEQEEYMREGIQWKNIEFIDNTECLDLFSKKPTGLLYLLDEECNFPGATNETLLNKFNTQHQNNPHFEVPQTRQSTFSIVHYAGKVKYYIQDFREKNSDLMRHDIVVLLKNSNMAFLRELVGQDPLAVMRWARVRVFFRALFAFIDAGRRHRKSGTSLARFGGITRSEQMSKWSPVRTESRTSLCGDKTKSKTDRPWGHSPSIEEMSPTLSLSRMFRKKPNRRLSCPGDRGSIAEATKNYEKMESPISESTEQLQKSPSTIVKNKVYRPRMRAVRQLREQETNRSMGSNKVPLGMRTSKTKTKPRSISAQFHTSLQRLMDTLNQANPFFIRCIKSNAEKAACVFDEELVQRQLRYTGMLATVKIRQSGYNYRLSFEDFIYQYHLLLPNGRRSSRTDIVAFLEKLDLNNENYQIGATKVFLRETEKLLLEDALHQALLNKIKRIQHWIRGRLQRMQYLHLRSSIIFIQRSGRAILDRQRTDKLFQEHYSCILIQSVFRGYTVRQRVRRQLEAVMKLQRVMRAFAAQKRYLQSKKEEENLKSETPAAAAEVKIDVTDDKSISLVQTEEEVKTNNRQTVDDEKKIDLESSDAGTDKVPNKVEPFKVDVVDGGVSHMKTTDGDASSSENIVFKSKLVQIIIDTSRVKTTQEEPCIMSPEADSVDGICNSVPEKSDALQTVATGDGSVASSATSSSVAIPINDVKTDENVVKPSCTNDSDSAARKDVKAVDDDGCVVFTLELPSSDAALDVKIPVDSEDELLNSDDQSEQEPKVYLSSSLPKEIMGPMHHTASPKQSRKLPHGLSKEEPCIPSYLRITRDNSPSSRRTIEKSQSAVIPSSMRTQAGPRDLEIEVKPAIVKASSEEILSSNVQTISRSAIMEKKVQAPLARLESISDEPVEDKGVKTLIMTIEDEGPQKKPPSQRSFDETSNDHTPKSRKLWKHKKAPNASPLVEGYLTGSRKDKHRKAKQQQQPPLSDAVSNTLPSSNVASSTSNTSSTAGGTWSVSGTAQWQYPLDLVVRNVTELKQFEYFFSTKTAHFSKSSGRKESVSDVVFKEALNEFHSNLITQVSTALQNSIMAYKYKDLMCRFEGVLMAKARQHQLTKDWPSTVFINAFRGYVDEFIKKRDNKELPDIKVKKETVKGKKKKQEIIFKYHGHEYIQIQFTIPTFCEICSSIIWVLEKGFVCKACKLTVHKKCHEKTLQCPGSTDHTASGSGGHSGIIGASLSDLLKDGLQIPPLIEQLISVIENNGLYTVGVYRKPGNAAQIKALIKLINTDASALDFSEYPIHNLTSALKAFFREMPEPLMTYDLYWDFIQVTDITDDKERIKSLYSLIEKLPQPNFLLLQRLIFHLAKVAQQEGCNLMSANALAIVFAPSVLRWHTELPAQESLNHVPKQTMCLQCIIESHLKKLNETLADIRNLDTAAVSANEKLATLRASKRSPKLVTVEIGDTNRQQPETPEEDHEEIILLSARIQSLQDEKEALTSLLPALEIRMSNSEEDMLSTDDIDSTGDELEENDDVSIISEKDNGYLQRQYRHLTRHRNKLTPHKTGKYRLEELKEIPARTCELKPARSDPELHKPDGDDDDDDLFH